MPVRDGASVLSRSVKSAQRQELRAWELLVIDDASSDPTPLIARGYTIDDPRIRLIRVRGHGLVDALQTGCREAAGRFIARLDADDECLPQRLQRQVEHLERHPNLGVVGSIVEFGGDPNAAEGYARHVDWANSILSHEEIVLNRLIDSRATGTRLAHLRGQKPRSWGRQAVRVYACMRMPR